MRKCLLAICLLLTPLIFTADEEIPEEGLIAAVDNLGPTAAGYLSEGDFGPDDEQFIDRHVLRDFVESKGLIECRQKSGLLTIAGDARARWVRASERAYDPENNIVKDVRGFNGTAKGVALNRFKSEINLFFDYVAPNSWVSTKLKWSNYDGKDGGTATKVDLDRAFLGYDVYRTDCSDFYVEVGRSKLDFMFESRVEFTSVFDGLHLYYTTCIPRVCTFIVHGGPFLIDGYTDHFVWVMEAFFKELADTPWSVKYSIIDWHRVAPTIDYGNLKTSGESLVGKNPRYRFVVSQMILGYQRPIDIFHCKTFYAYAAVLANTAAKKSFTTNYRYLNKAWYAGFTLGKLCKACDWSLDINYQAVQAQAVPEFDLSGIGHGNGQNTLFSDAILQGFDHGSAQGFTNYKGWCASFLFAMTDSLSLRTIAQEARPYNRSIGGDFHYKSFEMSFIYAW